MAEVVVYSSPTCPDCQALKTYLKEKGISFVEKDVSSDANARQELASKYGRLATPTIVIDGKVFVGFKENLKEIEELLTKE